MMKIVLKLVKKMSILMKKRILVIIFTIKKNIFLMEKLIKLIIVTKQKMTKKNII